MPSDSDSHKPCVLCGQTGKAQQALSIIRLSCCKGKCRDYDYIKATDPVSCCTTITLPDLRAPLNSAQHGAFLSDHVCSSHASDCSRGPWKREQQGRTPSISLLLHMSRKDIWWVLIIQICYLKLFLHVKVYFIFSCLSRFNKQANFSGLYHGKGHDIITNFKIMQKLHQIHFQISYK